MGGYQHLYPDSLSIFRINSKRQKDVELFQSAVVNTLLLNSKYSSLLIERQPPHYLSWDAHLWACVSRAICSPLSLLGAVPSDSAVRSESWTSASLFFRACSLGTNTGWNTRERHAGPLTEEGTKDSDFNHLINSVKYLNCLHEESLWKNKVLKWFFKRLCGSRKNHYLLKNHWFDRFFVEPWMVP